MIQEKRPMPSDEEKHGETLLQLARRDPNFIAMFVANPVRAFIQYGIKADAPTIDILNKVAADMRKRVIDALERTDWAKCCNACNNCCVPVYA